MKLIYIILAAMWTKIGILGVTSPSSGETFLLTIMVISSIIMIGFQDSLITRSQDNCKKVLDGWRKTIDTIIHTSKQRNEDDATR